MLHTQSQKESLYLLGHVGFDDCVNFNVGSDPDSAAKLVEPKLFFRSLQIVIRPRASWIQVWLLNQFFVFLSKKNYAKTKNSCHACESDGKLGMAR